jgi:hypothetical protein
MPKLPAKVQENAEKADVGGGRAPLEEGVYVLRLHSVDPTGKGPAGPYWTFEYRVVEGPDGPIGGNKRLWDRVSLSDAAAFRVRNLYDSFGFTLDSDTDELIGEHVRAYVIQETIQSGSRAGQIGNTISEYMELPEEFEAATAGAAAGDSF